MDAQTIKGLYKDVFEFHEPLSRSEIWKLRIQSLLCMTMRVKSYAEYADGSKKCVMKGYLNKHGYHITWESTEKEGSPHA